MDDGHPVVAGEPALKAADGSTIELDGDDPGAGADEHRRDCAMTGVGDEGYRGQRAEGRAG